MNKFTAGPWVKSKSTTVQGNPSWRFDSAFVSLIAAMTYPSEAERDADEGTATLIENCTDLAIALEKAKAALHAIIENGVCEDCEELRAARIARDVAAATLVNAVGEG